MILNDHSSDQLMTLIDTSRNTINNSWCMEGFAHHQFLLVDRPGFAISQEAEETPFSAGDVIFVAAGRCFGIRCGGEMNIHHIAFTGKNIRPLLHYCRFGEFRITSPSDENYAEQAFEAIYSLSSEKKSAAKDIIISEKLYSLLAYLGGENIENDNYVFDKHSLILRPVIRYMRDNYREKHISYDELTASLGIDEEELDTEFKNVFFMDAGSFFKQLRMDNAKHLLFFYRARGVRYVAENMGYEGETEFRDDFYSCFGIDADEFIKLYWGKK